jgi:hypothetical protein
MVMRLMNQLPELIDPVLNTLRKYKLDHTPRRKKKYKKANKKIQKIAFNPDITEKNNPRSAIRILRERDNYKIRRTGPAKIMKPAYRDQNRSKEMIEIYFVGF